MAEPGRFPGPLQLSYSIPNMNRQLRNRFFVSFFFLQSTGLFIQHISVGLLDAGPCSGGAPLLRAQLFHLLTLFSLDF